MAQGLVSSDDGTFDVPVEVDGAIRSRAELPRLLAVRPRLLLLGEPGAGRTTTLRWLARRAAAAHEADPRRHPPPVLVPLSRWPADTAFGDFMSGHRDADRLLLLDGLDELGAEPEPRIREIVQWLDSTSPAQAVLTGRPPGPDRLELGGLTRVTLRELGPDQVRQAAGRRLGPRAPDFLAQLQRCRLTRNPYLLSALFYLYAHQPDGGPRDGLLPRDAGRLLGRLAEAVWARQRRRDPTVPPWSHAVEGHIRLARTMDEKGHDPTPEQVVQSFVSDRLPATSLAAGLLVRDGRHVRFEHDWLRAYFLAEAFAGVGADPFLAWCRSRVPHWQAVAVAWSGLSPHADAFLARLHWSDAAELLGRGYLAGPGVVRRHVQRALSDLNAGDWRMFPAVLTGLARIGEPAVPALVTGLAATADERVRARIAYALGRIGGAGAVAALRPMLRAAPGLPREQAGAALLSIGGRPAHEALAEWHADPQPALRAAAATALARVDRPDRDAHLVALAADADPRVRAAAIAALGLVGTDLPADALSGHAGDGDPRVRAAALDALAARGDRAARPVVEAAFGDPDDQVRLAAVRAAGLLGTDAPTSLLRALTDASDTVRAQAAPALATAAGEDPGPAIVDGLLDALTAGPEPVCRAAAAALAAIGPAGRATLHGLLAGDDPGLWSAAAEELLRAGWTPPDGDNEVRAAVAVHAWGRCRRLGTAAVPQLRRTLRHADPDRRRGIARTLRALGWQPTGTDQDLFRYYAGLVDRARLHRCETVDLIGFAAWSGPPRVDGHPLRETARLLCTEATDGIDETLLCESLRGGDVDERMLATVVAGWSGAGRAELFDALAPTAPDLQVLLAAQALGEQPADPAGLADLLCRVADTADALRSPAFGEAVLVAAVQGVGRATAITELLDEVPATALGADGRLDLLDSLWAAFGPDVTARLAEQSIGEFLHALADVDRSGLPAVSTLNFPLVLWELHRRVAVLTTTMFLAGFDAKVVLRVLQSMARFSPTAVRRVLDAVGLWAAADFAAEIKAVAAEL